MSQYITLFKSPNYNKRAVGTKIEFLIIHYTECNLGDSLHALTNASAACPVSAHYVVDENGDVYALVDEKFRAWHAGSSRWHDLEDINSRSIGIELVHPGYKSNYREFSEKQINSLITLCHDILSRHSISPQQVLGHSDIAPLRKKDPGHLFDWRRLAQEGIGFYPNFDVISDRNLWRLNTTGATTKNSQEPQNLILEIQHQLMMYGYFIESPRGDLTLETQAVIRAFQMHFWPQCVDGQATPALKQRLAFLNVSNQATRS